MDMGQPKPAADKPAVAEDLPDLIGLRIRGNVEVFRFTTKQQVANAAADKVGLVSLLFQAIKHPDSIGTDPLAGNRVIFTGDDRRLHGGHGSVYYHTGAGKVKKEVRSGGEL
jgi:hypothetical protein